MILREKLTHAFMAVNKNEVF